MDWNKEIIRIKDKLPLSLMTQASKTLQVLTQTAQLTVLQEALYWNTVSLAYEHGQEAGLRQSMKETLDTLKSIGGHKS